MEIDGWFIRSPQRKVVRGWRCRGGGEEAGGEGGALPPPTPPHLSLFLFLRLHLPSFYFVTPPPFPCRSHFHKVWKKLEWHLVELAPPPRTSSLPASKFTRLGFLFGSSPNQYHCPKHAWLLSARNVKYFIRNQWKMLSHNVEQRGKNIPGSTPDPDLHQNLTGASKPHPFTEFCFL